MAGNAAAPAPALRTDVVWTLAGNLVFAATQWAMLVVLARLGSPADVGRYTLGLAVTTPVFLLLSLQLRGAQATEPPDSPYRFGHYFTLRTLLAGLALALCAGWALLSAGPQAQAGLAAVTGWLALAKLFDGLSDVCYGHLQVGGRLTEVARSLMLRGTLSALGLSREEERLYRRLLPLSGSAVEVVAAGLKTPPVELPGLIEGLAGSDAACGALLEGFGTGGVEAKDGLDGVRMRLGSGEIVHLRLSGNAPELRCYTEAATPARAAELLAGVLGRVERML